MADDDLPTRLTQLAQIVERPRDEDGRLAELTALMPCEPAVGDVVVACWRDSTGGELVELLWLHDATRVNDPVALREALALLAMVETIEELAAFSLLDEVHGQLAAWASDLLAPSERFEQARAAALEAIEQLCALAPEQVRIARTRQLDAIGTALRALETRWSALEQAAEAWSDAVVARCGSDDPTAAAEVRELWRLLGEVRRGPLGTSVAAALHQGREAGVAMAAEIAAAMAR